jgi:excisionase family DNA binding protein
MEKPSNSPWLTAREAGAYLKHSRNFVLREVRAGRLRAAIVGGRKEILTRAEWCDQWVEDRTKPMPFTSRHRA